MKPEDILSTLLVGFFGLPGELVSKFASYFIASLNVINEPYKAQLELLGLITYLSHLVILKNG